MIIRPENEETEPGMKAYDLDTGPRASDWLSSDEDERLALVESYHRRRRIHVPRARVHAVIHVAVENQLALGGQFVVETFARLCADGLSRHDAVHAIGSVLAEHLNKLLSGEALAPDVDRHREYFDALKSLTADAWRNSG
jgi:hypothetical protein